MPTISYLEKTYTITAREPSIYIVNVSYSFTQFSTIAKTYTTNGTRTVYISTNKFSHISKQISLNNLNLNFAHYKRIMKFQYLKYGKT